MKKLTQVFIMLTVLILFPETLSGQGTNIEFGQNRVQYKEFTWSYYQSENFVTYYYMGGQSIGKFSAQYAESILKEIEKTLDYRLNNKLELLVYNDISDLNQSNIGIGIDLKNIGGYTKIIGNKIFVYFNGNHLDLMHQINIGVTDVILNNMLFGNNLQEILQNAVLLSLPDWFQQGLTEYISEPWNTTLDNRLRDGILSGRYKKFSKLVAEDPGFAGHAFWYYIAENYGLEAIPNLLYLTRINRSLENGLLFVLGMNYPQATDAWFSYFQTRYLQESGLGTRPSASKLIDWKPKKNRHYTQIKLNRNARKIAFVEHQLGAYKVKIRDIETGQTQQILKGGFKTKTVVNDLDYPLLAWDPSGRKLVLIYEKRDIIQMMIYDLANGSKEVKDVTKFQKIQSIEFSNNPNVLLLSAINRGQSDIYTYNIRSKTAHQITNDYFDDLNPHYLDLGKIKGIAFASNRINDTLKKVKMDTMLPDRNFDLYLLAENPRTPHLLLNLTNTPYLNEFNTQQLDSIHFSFLSDLNGIQNRYAGYIDSILDYTLQSIYYRDSTVEKKLNTVGNAELSINDSLIDSISYKPVYKDTAYYFSISNFRVNILSDDIVPATGKILSYFLNDGKEKLYLTDIPVINNQKHGESLAKTYFRENGILKQSIIKPTNKHQKEKEKQIDPGFFFQSEFMDTGEGSSLLKPTHESTSFVPSAVLPYRIKFSTDYVLSQLDNTVIINQYNNFVGNGPVYQNQDISGMLTMSISDLMEDYRITGGFRMPTSLKGSEYFVTYEALKKRLDKKFLLYRKTGLNTYDFTPAWYNNVLAHQKLTYYEMSLKYPFDILRSIRGKFGLRDYKLVFLSTDTFSLNTPDYQENWLSARFEYVFDNSYPVDLNILNGMRYNVYFEVQKQFDAEIKPKPKFDLSLGTMAIAGFDFRYYQPVHRNIVWANRIAAATSFGSKKMIYYLGGEDNWLLPRFDHEIEVNQNNNYAFQTLATNLRGFDQNIRNGNSFAVINSELRIPLFTYLINRPIKNEFFHNFQLIGFGDIGTAWEGRSPFAEDNPFNTEILENGPVKILVKYFKNPIVGGYGFGARSTLFGYFVRSDIAWGIDSGVRQKPMLYISLGLDF